MNAVEIEQAVSALAEQPFDAAAFPFAFLEAFGRKATTLKKLRSGESNRSDCGGVLQTGHIHLAVAPTGEVGATLTALKASPATARAKARFVLATDGVTLEAEDLQSDDAPIVCAYADLPNRFAAFLPLAGITTVKQLRESSVDIRATGRLNKLYLELRRLNPEWDKPERRPDMNHFMARLIFCFFAQSTDIFLGDGLFSDTLAQMSARDGADTHVVMETIFRAMNTKPGEKAGARLPAWAEAFPHVNGGLFSGSTEVPRFNGIARSYLLHIGGLDWRQINPDIFGSMIQAVADDEERGALGMHYTSVPNILKVLNPLFLDELNAKLAEAGDNARTLLNLRRRMSRIRVFDPACGSGNFLVIAYKEMRKIQAEINRLRGEPDRRSDIPLTNFRGIEIRDFPAEIARLALIIAEYQCDVLYRGQKEALADFLPLDAENWIVCGNALRLDWLSVCPPIGIGVKHSADDLFETLLDQAQIDFEHKGGETYICGNPPYLGSKWQSDDQKVDLSGIFDGRATNWKSVDYVAGWFMKAADYNAFTSSAAAFVSTNSICQGQQAQILWPLLFRNGQEIVFAYTSFKWVNLASHNAGVTVVIVGISKHVGKVRQLFSTDESGAINLRQADIINAYLVAAPIIEVEGARRSISNLALMQFGNHPYYGAALIFSTSEAKRMLETDPRVASFVRPLYGSREFISAAPRACLWISDDNLIAARRISPIVERIEAVATARRAVKQDMAAQKLAKTPHRFRDQETATSHAIIVPRVSSENRRCLPVGLLEANAIIQDQAFALYDSPLWNLALIASRLHIVWIATVCGKLKTDFRYSNTLGWNTFPVPALTDKNKADLTRCAEDILLAREAHFPATIADLYDPEAMPADLRAAHERNDETLERIYIGRRFKNDTERLAKLFDMYTKMVGDRAGPSKSKVAS